MRSPFANRSLLADLLLLLLVCVSITITAVSFFSYSIVEREFTSKITSQESKLLEAANEHMTYLLKDIEGISDKVYINRDMRQTLSASSDDLSVMRQDAQADTIFNLSYFDDFFTDTRLPYRWMKYDVYILGGNGYRRRYSSASNARTNILYEDVIKTDWYQEVLALGGQPMVVPGNLSGLKFIDERVLYTRLLKNLSTSEPTGIFILSFNKQTFDYIYRTLLDDTYADLGLTTGAGQPVWGATPPGLEGHLPFGGESGSYRHSAQGVDYQVLYAQIAGTDWYVTRALNLNLLLSFTGKLRWSVIALCLVCTLLVFLFSALIVRRVYRPIDMLLSSMRTLRLGRIDTSMLDTARNDEIGLLNRGFADMAAKLDDSVALLMQEQNQKRLAEIQALQAQIRPHFLYNTLTSIRCVVRAGDNETAQQMIIALVKLLKSSLNGADEFITLAQEIEVLKSYVLICQIRFANFDIDYCAEEAALTCLTPRLILQPLVENSIVHGLGDRDGSLSIRVYAYLQDELLIVDVTDDGVGFSPEARARLLDEQGRLVGQEGSVGLRNVAERIALSFGPEYGLSLVNPTKSGTRIRLTMPARRAKEA